uniref:F-box domain-containing protein n=1 Tax=Meloidogyne enterolobii TaxID=390850 RepID=A0A6V7VGN9_MELEN|nr:unnamed protein product [Meloidogyne enterolobii]
MFNSLPTEVKLDIFKCLNYKELYSIKQTNFCFYAFINKYEGELAREKLSRISDHFRQSKEVESKLIRPEAENFDFALFDEQHKEFNEQLEVKWSGGLQKPIPLYLPDQGLDSKMAICLVNTHNYKTRQILLELPHIITSKNQMKIVYYYLDRLFNCSFDFGYFDQFIFNPELIELLFGRIPKQIYLWTTFLMPSKAYNSENFFKFFVNNLIGLSLRIDLYRVNAEEYLEVLQKILMKEGDKFGSVYLSCNKMPKLFESIINYNETSKDCSEIVNCFELNYLDTFTYPNQTKYQLSNKHNPKIEFFIFLRMVSYETKKNILQISRN